MMSVFKKKEYITDLIYLILSLARFNVYVIKVL